MKKQKFLKGIAVYMALSLLFEIFYPTVALALTGGPAQPESSAFTPVGTSDMVNLFSGDYNYNIPLLDVGGYPVNISYNSGISMDQEASWVGLGWNINPGAINRNMRGLPDEFKGDKVTKEFNVKPNQTYGVNTGVGFSIAGFEALSLNFSVGAKYNNYTGVGFEQSANIAITAGESGKTSGTASLGLHSSADGLDISPSVSMSAKNTNKDNVDTKFGASLGASFNSRAGLKALTISTSVSQSQKVKNDKQEVIGSTSGGSMGTGCSIDFNNPTYVPSQGMPMKNLSVNTSFQLGTTIYTADVTFNGTGYYSEQRLAQTKQIVPAYGYLNSDEGSALDKVLMDFNREKDGSFTKTTPCLPLTNYTYDLFSVSGQGVGGMFRPFRSDLGYVFDSRSTNTSDSYSLGVEIGLAMTAHAGVDVTINDVNSTTGKWTDNNDAASRLKFRKTVNGKPLYEPYYFKEAGEKNVDSYSALYNAIGGDQPVRIGLQDQGAFEVNAKNTFVVGGNSYGSEPNIPSVNYRPVRQRRNQLFSSISLGEYSKSAVDKDLFTSIYNHNGSVTPAVNTNHHIAEITTTKTDGSRYVYGIPAYNTKQREVTFNMSKFDGEGDVNTATTGLIQYNPGVDNTTGNLKGLDNYFSSTELPAYAHSYLLTAVLSVDYVDVTGNGPSIDDLGTYTKFSYSKNQNLYNWRVPYSSNKANFNEGLKTIHSDEQGNYVYGEKEIWILNKIETKNYVAIFTTTKSTAGGRADGFDVAGENGGIGTNPGKLLKKIALYSRPDYELYIGNLNLATPIKEVHFVYDYSLCQGTLNNVAGASGLWTRDTECEGVNLGGKLTLKQIYFTYGKSNKAKLNPYTFDYSAFNPSYGMKDYDKWGNYKPNSATLTNAEFPYVDQELIPITDVQNYDSNYPNRTYADLYSSAWTLNKITLPSGGTINVQYESDDYAFVQDRRAMQMFKITGLGTSSANNPVNSVSDLSQNSFMFFKLQDPIPTITGGAQTSKSVLYEKYLRGINDLYFRALVHVNGNGNDYVSGYAEGIYDYNFVTETSTISNIAGVDCYTYGYIQLNPVTIEDHTGSSVNPISKAAVQFARVNTPKEAYGNSNFAEPTDPNPSAVSIISVVKAMADASFINNMIAAFQGANGYLYNQDLGKNIVLNKSWVRLLNPNMKKLGGGSRVKKITISDEWGDMLDNDGILHNNTTKDFSYGQEYDYTKVENGQVISSGVASYEPLVGGDENPFRLPVAFSQKMKLAADLDYFQEEPYGESFFPSASVGYSKVTVKNLQRYKNDANPSLGVKVQRHATGSVVSEFFTSRDYPTITKRTPIDARPKKTGALLKLLKLSVRDYMTASQGFQIELNDMHGKPKATWVYAEDQVTSISGVEYKYKSNGNKLNNSATVINKDGSIQTTNIGIDYDFVADMREQKTDVINAGLQVNLYGFLVSVVPCVIPPILPSFSTERTRFRSASVTKVINHFGLLEETIAYDLGSKVSTQNLAYDSETGEVLLTKTKNDFNDEMYSVNFPAHLAYDRMGPGYKNVGVVLNSSNGLNINSSGKVVSNPSNILIPGDEVQITPLPTALSADRYWISKETGTGNLYVIDKNGNHVTTISSSASIKVIRSGHRNEQGVSIGSFASLVNPIDKDNNLVYDSQLNAFDESYKVLNASAVEYSEVWRTFCECGVNPDDPSSPHNPYLLGKLGSWRTKKSYTFLSDRNQTKVNDNSNIRKDGTYKYFRQFWSPFGLNDWTSPGDITSTNSNWTWTSEVTEYSPYGPELENKDALNRYSAAVYGYNNSLPIAIGSNSQYRQMANDNFEDYNFDDCPDDHFSYERPLSIITSGAAIDGTQSHTGKRSIKVPAGTSITVTKPLLECTDLQQP
ncbi:MAG: hypothetical protein A3F72_01630 [Bacteroidetes bacterium RIFCSPLOWO2_12_FULL_35_15]|nr:MAG: hypothetical protein A3F72_01630 [Bacteroidetes bacterium RIFCSPLOWO2_12_FULL_35_15]